VAPNAAFFVYVGEKECFCLVLLPFGGLESKGKGEKIEINADKPAGGV
jgi:hypothetical protein